MMELLVTEVAVSSEVARVMRNVGMVTGMESRLREELQDRARVRQREAKISRKLELESGWMTMRLRVEEGEHLELEEDVLELMMATLGLEEDDLCRKEEDGKDSIG